MEEKWRQCVERCHKEIITFLNPLELWSYMANRGLLSSRDKDIQLMDVKPREDKVRHILKVLETTDKEDPYTKFVKCLHDEVHRKESGGFHMGHKYLLSILEGGEPYASEEELGASAASKACVLSHMSDLHDIEISSLVLVMYSYNLLTREESNMLFKIDGKAAVFKLLQILDTKGPLAYTVFVQCLGEEESAMELHQKITSRKRPRNPENVDQVCLVPKRQLQRIRIEKPFCGKEFSEFMASIHKCYLNSSWEKMESLAQNFILQTTDLQLKVLAIIVKGYSFSYRKGMEKKALECSQEAMDIIEEKKINGGNYYFLLARCKHIKATIHRYLGREDKSLKENNEALEVLHACEPGDDASLLMYAIACAKLEMFGKTQHIPPLQDINQVHAYLDFCVKHCREGATGLCASEARCLIRLAQLSLQTTTDGKCWAPVSESAIRKAEGCLKQVDVSSISRRCQALYYVVESDLFRSMDMDNTAKAIESTKKALKIAEENQLGAEQRYAKSRLQILK